MIKSIIIPLFFITFVVIFARGEPECPKNIKTTTTLPIEGDCKKFYICSPLGGKVGLSCLHGYNFNPETGICEDEKKYKCPYPQNDSPQSRFDTTRVRKYPWAKVNSTYGGGDDSVEDGSGNDLEVLGRTFFNWFKDGDKKSDPSIFLRAFIRRVLLSILSPILFPIKKLLKICKNVFMVLNNLFGSCDNENDE